MASGTRGQPFLALSFHTLAHSLLLYSEIGYPNLHTIKALLWELGKERMSDRQRHRQETGERERQTGRNKDIDMDRGRQRQRQRQIINARNYIHTKNNILQVS